MWQCGGSKSWGQCVCREVCRTATFTQWPAFHADGLHINTHCPCFFFFSFSSHPPCFCNFFIVSSNTLAHTHQSASSPHTALCDLWLNGRLICKHHTCQSYNGEQGNEEQGMVWVWQCGEAGSDWGMKREEPMQFITWVHFPQHQGTGK